ncbi:MAG: 2-phosphosulfolactate phosphatase [Hyphomicrobiales bacterium]
MTRRIELAVLPAEALAIDAGAYIVVDQLRATTNIATLLAAGMDEVLVVDDIERARSEAKQRGALLCGEVGGFPPPGFDRGNSPIEAEEAARQGGTAVLFTSNGTRALCSLAGRGPTFAGALVNAGAVSRAASGYDTVAVVCAGTGYGLRFSQDDFAAGAEIVRRLAERTGAEPGDAARLALSAIAGGPPAVEHLVRTSSHARGLAAAGFGPDIDYALRVDRWQVVPAVVACGEGWALLRPGRAHAAAG